MRNLLLLLFIPFASNAQKNFFLGAEVAYNNTRLLNADDRSADSRLDYKLSQAPEMGLNLGYSFGQKSFLNAITVGLKYSTVVQKYSGNNTDDFRSGVRELKAKTNLSYLKIPILAHFVLSENKTRPYISIGGYYARLLNSKDEMNGLGAYIVNGQNYPVYHRVNGLNYSSNSFVTGSISGTLDKPYYKKNIWGVEVATGFQSELSQKALITFGIRGAYSLNDIENKVAIYHDNYAFNPWNTMSPKYYSDNSTVMHTNTSRPATHLLSLGLEVGIRYRL